MSNDATPAGRTFKKPVTVTIDGREIVAEAGEPLLQVALDNGIEIPHYCYHPKLSIDGSCRMCQVKIEKAPKLAISCNTPVADGMVVDTQAPEVADARKGVMELLLVNHPLDCPICDQAGECYLQDYSVGYGRSDARTRSPRRKGVKRFPIGPRVLFDQERCILCRRCVRFTHEITHTNELRVFGAGDRSRIGTSAERPLANEYSINTADICPVGALLSADFHHKRRVWFLTETESVCSGCANGCNIKIGVYRNEIQRLLPRRNDDVNDTWMCDSGRLNYKFVADETRLRTPWVRGASNGGGADVPLDAAIDAAGEKIRAAIDAHGPGAVAVIGSPHLTNEEIFVLGRVVRDAIQTPHFDMAVPTGPADALLIKEEKAANATGARDLGLSPGEGGRDAAGILAACAAGEVKVLWVIGSADVLAVFGEEKVMAAVAGLDALVVQDTNRTPLTGHASVVLPGLVWAEKDGSFTNFAGRVQRIRPAVAAPEGLLPDGDVFARLAARLKGGTAAAFDPRAVFGEIAASVAKYADLGLAGLGSRGAIAGTAPAPTEDAASAAVPA